MKSCLFNISWELQLSGLSEAVSGINKATSTIALGGMSACLYRYCLI